MSVQIKNNASSTLVSTIDSVQTTITVQLADAVRFPTPAVGDWFPLTLVDGAGNIEIVRATARTGQTITVVRAQEGTIGRAFTAAATRVDLRMTGGAFDALVVDEVTEQMATAVAAFQTTLDGKQAKSEENQANGYAGLDADGKVLRANLPLIADMGIGDILYSATPVPNAPGTWLPTNTKYLKSAYPALAAKLPFSYNLLPKVVGLTGTGGVPPNGLVFDSKKAESAGLNTMCHFGTTTGGYGYMYFFNRYTGNYLGRRQWWSGTLPTANNWAFTKLVNGRVFNFCRDHGNAYSVPYGSDHNTVPLVEALPASIQALLANFSPVDLSYINGNYYLSTVQGVWRGATMATLTKVFANSCDSVVGPLPNGRLVLLFNNCFYWSADDGVNWTAGIAWSADPLGAANDINGTCHLVGGVAIAAANSASSSTVRFWQYTTTGADLLRFGTAGTPALTNAPDVWNNEILFSNGTSGSVAVYIKNQKLVDMIADDWPGAVLNMGNGHLLGDGLSSIDMSSSNGTVLAGGLYRLAFDPATEFVTPTIKTTSIFLFGFVRAL